PILTAPSTQISFQEDTVFNGTFTITDEEPIDCSGVTVTAVSSPTVIPLASVVIGGAGTNCTVDMTPDPDQNTGFPATAMTVELSITDGGGLTGTLTLNVVVVSINDQPTFVLADTDIDVATEGTPGIANQTYDNLATTIVLGPNEEPGVQAVQAFDVEIL